MGKNTENDISDVERAFIYKLQFQRGLNPMYIPFTKKGFFLVILIVFAIYSGWTGISLTFTSAVSFWWIYRTDFDYKYNEKERVWLFSLWNDFLTSRREKPFFSEPIFFGKGE